MLQFFKNMGWLLEEWRYADETRKASMASRLEGKGNKELHSPAKYTFFWCGASFGLLLAMAAIGGFLYFFTLQTMIFFGVLLALTGAFFAVMSIVELSSYHRNSPVVEHWKKQHGQSR